jgi:hypothetical protein
LSPPDRFLIQARYLADQNRTPMISPIGFNRRVPSTLLLIKTAQDYIDLVMDHFLTIIFLTLTNFTQTLMKWFSTQLFLSSLFCFLARI